MRCAFCGTAIDLKQRSAKFCSRRCKDKAWRRANPGYQAEWLESHRQDGVSYTTAWQRAKQARDQTGKRFDWALWYKNHRDQEVERQRKWRSDNPESARACDRRKRAKRARAVGSLSAREWRAIVLKQRGRCADCRKRTKLTIDHVVPLAAGGSHYAFNIQGLCGKCNTVKRDRIAVGTQYTLFDRIA
jgi:5-methylcytosine-specific restriction endonuclease McrA